MRGHQRESQMFSPPWNLIHFHPHHSKTCFCMCWHVLMTCCNTYMKHITPMSVVIGSKKPCDPVQGLSRRRLMDGSSPYKFLLFLLPNAWHDMFQLLAQIKSYVKNLRSADSAVCTIINTNLILPFSKVYWYIGKRELTKWQNVIMWGGGCQIWAQL